ncbi:MAG TPA: hypothetical protein QGH10_20440, partial [Armatimonadota bacterium]|nr:hypothetical protein [Armatimonadota bacterium]
MEREDNPNAAAYKERHRSVMQAFAGVFIVAAVLVVGFAGLMLIGRPGLRQLDCHLNFEHMSV